MGLAQRTFLKVYRMCLAEVEKPRCGAYHGGIEQVQIPGVPISF